jgi:putative membrane protein
MMGKLVTLVAVNALALMAAVWFVPGISWPAAKQPGPELVQLVGMALIFAAINTLVKPVVSLLTFPVTFMTMGLFALVVNGAMLLLLAWVAAQAGMDFRVGGFPPDLSLSAIGTAILGSIVVSVASTVLRMVIDR